MRDWRGGRVMPDQPSAAAKPVTLFLSYSRQDEVRAKRLAAVLEQAGYAVWWDALIEGGTAYSQSIADALETADAVIVLRPRHSIASDWVKDEAAQGRERHRLIPLSIDGTQPPLGFHQYPLIDFSHWRGRGNAPEIAAIERAIGAALGSGHGSHSSGQARISRRGMLIGGSAATAAIVGAGGIWLASERGWIGGGAAPLSIAVLPFRNM